jgi:hypothetical protein
VLRAAWSSWCNTRAAAHSHPKNAGMAVMRCILDQRRTLCHAPPPDDLYTMVKRFVLTVHRNKFSSPFD